MRLGWGGWFLVLFSVIPRAALADATCSPACYGSGLAADGLANTIVGGPSGDSVSFRFRAQYSGLLTGVRLYVIPDRSGHAAGSGGTIRISVHRDDGTNAHNPIGDALSYQILSNPLSASPSRYFPQVSFSTPTRLVAGELYHILFTNVSPNPSANYLSVQALYQRSPGIPAQPIADDTSGAVLQRPAGGKWTVRKGHTPILQLDYYDGSSQGTGYLEAWVGSPQAISGSSSVRETFTVSGPQRNATAVAVSVGRVKGADSLTIRLEEADGTLVEQVQIPSTSIPLTNPVSYTWAKITFSRPRLLLSGRTYHLVLQAPTSTIYQVFPIREGRGYGFEEATFFSDGYAQFKEGNRWVGWTQWGVTDRTDGDLSFFFDLETVDQAPATPPRNSLRISTTCPSGCYGPGVGADGLANTIVGGPNDIVVSYRFRATHTGSLRAVHLYLIPDRAGYAGGTGGKISMTLNLDDGSAAHNPSSTAISSYVLSRPLAATPSPYFPVLTFSAPPLLVAGQLYHLVLTNVDSSPSTNYLSIDALYLKGDPVPTRPTIDDIDSAILLRSRGREWAQRKGHAPILQLDYSDGWSEGAGYMEAWPSSPQTISGTASVRERFTVIGSSKDVQRVALRVARASGSSPLRVRLETADGALIEEGNIPASAIPLTNPISHTWVELKFLASHRLLSGQTYHLVLQSSSVYQAYPVRKGSAYGFADTTYFADGYAQFKQGNSWVGWAQWGTINRSDGDLQFYFVLQ